MGRDGALAIPTSWDSHNEEDRVWLSLCHTLLFFSVSPSPDEAPYAFVYLKTLLMERQEPELSTLTLVASPDANHAKTEGEAEPADVSEATKLPKAAEQRHVAVVFLLPDGRWQEFELPRLEIQFPDSQQLEKWS